MDTDNTSVPSLNMGTFNANGLGDKNKRVEVLNWLKRKGDDLIILQETHCTDLTAHNWVSEIGRPIVFNNGTSNSTGTAFLLLNKNIKVERHKIIEQGRISLLEFEYENLKYCLVNVYAPNSDDVELLEKMATEVFGRDRDDLLILAGDWNTVLCNSLDKIGGSANHSNKKCQSFLNSLMSEGGLFDPFRVNNPSDKKFTHFNKKSITGTRLDFFLVDNNVMNLPKCESTISHGFKSDHSYVHLGLIGNTIERGRGYWKFNNSLLDSENFCSDVKQTIESTLEQDFNSWGGVWDTIKFKIKDVAIKYGKKRKSEFLESKRRLETRISELESLLPSTPEVDSNVIHQNLHETRQKLDDLTAHEIRGIITRARLQWVEEGERSSKYFLGLEKCSAKKRSVTNLVTDEGASLTSQLDISRHVVDFYRKLFSSRDPHMTDIQQYLENSKLEKIDTPTSESIDRPIDIDELTKIVESLKTNKSPGWDGLSSEFFIKFWVELGPTLLKVLDEAYETMLLPPSMRIGVISLIPKPKPPPELKHIKNWRPITLLNTDYKILTHAIKSRIMQAVPKLISNSQSGFQPGKSTCDNLILMYLVLEYYDSHPDEEGLLLEIDYARAFDSVEFEYLFETLKYMGFGERLINLVRLAYRECTSYANVNGHLSDPIPLKRGVHQGSPLSPALFLLVAQTFTNNMEANVNIKGLELEGVGILQSLFADDTDLFLRADTRVVHEVFEELRIFGNVSGCKINTSKTVCIPLGRARANARLLVDLRQSYGQGFVPDTGFYTALGLQFGNKVKLEEIVRINYETKINKIESLIKSWSKRFLTIYGRLTIIKTLLLSQLVYLIVPLPRPPKTIINKIDRILHQFLWGGKTEKLARKQIEKPKSAGGLEMIDFESFYISLKIKAFRKLFTESFEHPWKKIFLAQLVRPKEIFISTFNCLVKPKREFSQDLVKCVREWSEKSVNEVKQKTINEIIWCNKFVSGSQNTIWNSYLINNNILFISDFIDISGNILSYDQFMSKYSHIEALSFSKSDYLPIRMTLKCFHNPNNPIKSISNVDHNPGLPPFSIKTDKVMTLSSKALRANTIIDKNSVLLSPVIKWDVSIAVETDWNKTFKYLYTTSKNFKLVQHHFKVLSRIATNRYMRHKMKLESSPICSKCGSNSNSLETLEHIYTRCRDSTEFMSRVGDWIREEVDPLFSNTGFPNITLMNENKIVRLRLLIANWYLGQKYQYKTVIIWAQFISIARSMLALG